MKEWNKVQSIGQIDVVPTAVQVWQPAALQ